MRQIIGFLGSLAVGLLMAAAGLYFDVKTLTVAGLILFGFAAVLWLYEWGRTASSRANPAPAATPIRLKEPDLAEQIRRIVSNARVTVHNDRSDRGAEKALNSVRAMMLTLQKTKGIEFAKFCGNPKLDLEAALRVMEEVAPLIKEGHDEEAKQASKDWIAKLET